MNKLILLFGMLLCLVIVNGRHYGERNDETLESEEETLRRPKEHNSQARRRRRRWQMNYGYDYPPSAYHYPDRRDYDRNNQEVLQQIYKLLEEISSYVRRPQQPPPPPQPIYIPYPMPFNYPQIQSVPCTPPKADEKTPNVTKRISDKDMDSNRNWGLVVSSENDYDDESDGARPISFDPIVPKQIMKRPAPKVEHGSVQASLTTEAPKFQSDAAASPSVEALVPGMCNAAILSCCGMSTDKFQQRQCFATIGCAKSFADGRACSTESINQALESFKSAYSPI